MYCRMCGKKIGDTDHFCQFCGTPIGCAEPAAPTSEIKEEIIFNPPYEDKSQVSEEEELKEFIFENEREEAQQEVVQNTEETEASEPDKNSEFTWNVYEFPTEKKKTEEVEFNWNMEEFGQPEQKDAKDSAFEEELFQEIRDDSNRIKEQNIERFFTFSRKNEEFQELLDKEYEKFKTRTGPVVEILEDKPLKDSLEEDKPFEDSLEEQPAAPTVPLQTIHIEPEIPKEEPVTVLAGEDLFEAAEPEAEEAAQSEAEEVEQEAEHVETAEPAAELRAEHISEMEKARIQYFGEELIRDNESIRKKLTSGEPEDEPKHDIETAVMPVTRTAAETGDTAETIKTEVTEKAEETTVTEGDADRRAESVAAAYAAAALEKIEDQAEVPPSENPAETIAQEEIEESEPHRRSVGQIVLVIIAVILVIEIAILGIRYFAPDSGAAKAIGNAQTGIFNTVLGWFDGNGGQPSGTSDEQKALPEDNQKTDQDNVQKEESSTDTQTKEPAADPNPMADKNALVSSQMGNNKNIELVKANTALAWQQGKNYGLSDINDSKPITNNIWQAPETGDPIYYDKSVVGTVIAFDSKWIDYVNSGDKGVLALMKKDSEAYRKSVNYTKVGKIKETFKLLEIGEIRQGANGFYIWVHEEIGATENGKASDMKYNWIYYLEPVDGQMKIVNYYHF